ncbi:MAG: dihydrolipoyl dehydrogenase [Planctomycetota bacterium]|jgi:dihydrolipoamide dehydrogenase
MAEKFDIAVIGSGPGGARAARRCAQKGLSTIMIEKEYIGGVCLNWGCIPSKALLASTHTYLTAKNAQKMGIKVPSVKPDWQKIQKRKDDIVSGLRKGMTGSLKIDNLKMIQGRATVTEPKKIQVETENNTIEIEADKIILATGSESIELPNISFDGQTILSSKEVLSLPEIPTSMAIVGGGFIGCEMACVYAVLGCKVTIIEALESLLPAEDQWVGRLLAREFKKLGIDVLTQQKVMKIEKNNDSAQVILDSGQTIETEKVLVSVGRKAICDSETVEALSLEMDGPVIKVNKKFETSVSDVYAIGDCIGTSYLAHGATTEADIAAANVAGENEKMYDYSLIPRVVFTFPEVASIGKNEKTCQAEGIDISIGRAFFRANGRAVGQGEIAGEIRAVRDKATKKIIGIIMVGAMATELVTLARVLIGTEEDISNICFPHPTFSETLEDAILGA